MIKHVKLFSLYIKKYHTYTAFQQFGVGTIFYVFERCHLMFNQAAFFYFFYSKISWNIITI